MRIETLGNKAPTHSSMPTMRWPTQRHQQREQQGLLLELSDQQLSQAQGSVSQAYGQAVQWRQGPMGNPVPLEANHRPEGLDEC